MAFASVRSHTLSYERDEARWAHTNQAHHDSASEEMTIHNQALAAIFSSMAGLLAARQENPYKVRAYRRAAETVKNLPEDLSEWSRRGTLHTLPGIGKELSSKIQEFLTTGRIRAYEELKTPLPEMVRAWVDLPGFSEPVVHDLFFRLGISSWDDLEALAKSHLLLTLPGIAGCGEDLLMAIRQRRVAWELREEGKSNEGEHGLCGTQVSQVKET